PVTYNHQVQQRFMAACLNAPQAAMHPVRSCRCTLAQVETQYPQARFVALSLAHENGKPLPKKVKDDFEKCAI
ncbi:MAG TPA: hypothetical protein VE152_11990, partial [Acidimicrobiales bacterium]|nr:hypothetical protein [Acidimicrobiales bacterium]